MRFFSPIRTVAGSACALCLALTLLSSIDTLAAHAQRSKDPLTADQEEQVREVADQPNERVKLYVKFIEQRTDEIHQVLRHPDTQHPGIEIHDTMQEFTRLVDELEDNLDAYDEAHLDVRKSLKFLLDHAAKWPSDLNEPPPSPDYDFARKTALDAVASVTDASQSLLKSQEAYFAKQKAAKK